MGVALALGHCPQSAPLPRARAKAVPAGRAGAPDRVHTPRAWTSCCVSGVPVPEAVPSHGILLKPLHAPHRSAAPGWLKTPLRRWLRAKLT